MSYTITWETPANSTYDEIRIYRSASTIDPEAPPAPLATLGGGVKQYTDVNLEQFQRYYFRVGGVVGGIAYISSEELIADTYDLVGTDIFASNVAILLRTGHADNLTYTAPPNEGYATADLAERNDPAVNYNTSAERLHYGTSLFMDNPSPGGNGYDIVADATPSTQIGVADVFGPMTLETWMMREFATSSNTIISSTGTGVDQGMRWWIDSTGAMNVLMETEVAYIVQWQSSGVVIPHNEWVHLAIQRTNTRDWEAFVDGVSIGTFSQSDACADLNDYVFGGYRGYVASLDGYLDSFRWTVGIARYSDPFVPLEFPAMQASPVRSLPGDLRAIPRYIGFGQGSGGNLTLAPGYPTDWLPGDLMILHINEEPFDTIPTPPPAGGWQLVGSTQSGTTGDPQVGCTVYWKFAEIGDDTTPNFDPAGVANAVITAWRNASTISPMGAFALSSDGAVADTTVNLPDIQPEQPFSQIVWVTAHGDNTVRPSTPAPTNPGLFGAMTYWSDTDTGGTDTGLWAIHGLNPDTLLITGQAETINAPEFDATVGYEILGYIEGEVLVPVTGSGDIAIPATQLSGNGLTGSFAAPAALETPSVVLAGDGFVAPVIPQFVSSGSFASSVTVAVTPGLPAGYVDGDILLLHYGVNTDGSAPIPTNDFTGDGWTLAERTYGTVIPGLTSEVWWHRVSGAPTAPLIPILGSFVVAKISAWRGCKDIGSPINETSVLANDFGSTTFRVNGLTTTVADCMMIGFGVTGDDSVSYSNWANADLETVTEGYDHRLNTASGDSVLGMAYGRKLTAGVLGQFTADIGDPFAAHAAIGVALQGRHLGAALEVPAISLSGTGVRGQIGAGGLTTPAAALDGTGAIDTGLVTGTGALTVPASALGGSGVRTSQGSGDLTTPVAALDGTGIVDSGTVTGSGGLTIPSAALAGTGARAVTGDGVAAAPSITNVSNTQLTNAEAGETLTGAITSDGFWVAVVANDDSSTLSAVVTFNGAATTLAYMTAFTAGGSVEVHYLEAATAGDAAFTFDDIRGHYVSLYKLEGYTAAGLVFANNTTPIVSVPDGAAVIASIFTVVGTVNDISFAGSTTDFDVVWQTTDYRFRNESGVKSGAGNLALTVSQDGIRNGYGGIAFPLSGVPLPGGPTMPAAALGGTGAINGLVTGTGGLTVPVTALEGTGGSPLSKTETIDFATATGAELEIDVTGATRVVIRAVDMVKSDTSNAQLYVTTANGELSGTDDYFSGATSDTGVAYGLDTMSKWSNNLTSGANVTLLAEFTGLQEGAMFATKCVSSSSSNDQGTTMTGIEDATDETTAVTSIRFVDNFTSGTMYIDVITEPLAGVQAHDFSTATDVAMLIEDMDWMHVGGKNLDGTGSMKMSWRFSDITAPDTVISTGYKQGGQYATSDDYTATSAMGTYFGTTGAFDMTVKNFNLGSSVIQGSIGACAGTTPFAAQNGSIAKITGGVSKVTFDQWSDGNTFTSGDIWVETGAYHNAVVSEGTLASATTVAFDVTGKKECHFSFDLTSSGTSDYWGIQFDDGTGYATTTADYDWSTWTFNSAADRQAFDKVPMCATAGSVGTFTGEIFGLDGNGPTLGWAFGMLDSTGTTRCSLYHFDGTALDIEGIRFIRNASETWSGDYSFVTNEYMTTLPAAIESGSASARPVDIIDGGSASSRPADVIDGGEL